MGQVMYVHKKSVREKKECGLGGTVVEQEGHA